MAYQLCDQVSFCLPGGRSVFLDARRDRYFCLSGAAELAFRALLNGEPATSSGLGLLIQSQLVEEGEGGEPPMAAPSPSRPVRSLLEEPPATVSSRARVVVEVAWTVAKARLRMKRQAFAMIMDRLRARKRSAEAVEHGGADTSLQWASVFNTARRTAPIKPVCLPDSLALLDFLARRGVFADLVLGVKLNPFGAHSWVQTDQVILNDTVDHVNAHTPILVV